MANYAFRRCGARRTFGGLFLFFRFSGVHTLDWLSRTLNFKRGELPLGGLAALFHFCVLCGYFFLRPVREAMGVSRGMGDLRWLFVVTSISSLVVVLIFGGVVSRLDRRRFIPIGYLFVIVCLAAFSALLTISPRTSCCRWVGYLSLSL